MKIKSNGQWYEVAYVAVFGTTQLFFADEIEEVSNDECNVKSQPRQISNNYKPTKATGYKHNKAAKVGTEIKCPVCGSSFQKRQYSQAFCSSKCKNKYWNDLQPDRHIK
jgi:hypothetical protein